jgi:bleomycin hydrolase
MKSIFYSAALVLSAFSAHSQSYEFQTVNDVKCLPVISQGATGTCWSFSSTSFLESEILRLTGKNIDLSEMYNVRHTYPAKAYNYVMRQGKAQFSEGGLNHDVINSAKIAGLVPNSVYSGLPSGTEHDHSKLVPVLEKIVNANTSKPSETWQAEVIATLDNHLGKNVTDFTFEGKNYTPASFLAMTKLDLNAYVTITSFNHVPYYSAFVLNIPDNFSNGSFYNVPLDEFISNIDAALEKGYTVALDADVSEKTFSAKEGIAVIPADNNDSTTILTQIMPEKEVSAEYRQAEFENFNTTDDHLMHIVGKVKDQKGNQYYKVKNSWGTSGKNSGFIYMSVPYMKLKAISVLVHKDALDAKTRKALKV